MATPSLSGRQGSRVAQRVSAVISQHDGFVRAVIRVYAHNVWEEEELYQKLFLSLMSDPTLPYVQNMKSYLYHAIIRDAVDAARWMANERHRIKKIAKSAKFPVYNHTPDSALIIEEEMDRVLQCADEQLEARQATAVTLMYRDDFSIAEIAQQMNVEERTVSRYLTAGLRTLRRLLKR